jgi:hypothetical protein
MQAFLFFGFIVAGEEIESKWLHSVPPIYILIKNVIGIIDPFGMCWHSDHYTLLIQIVSIP